MKKISLMILSTICIAFISTACGSSEKRVKVSRLADYVFEVNPYTSLDEKYADNYYLSTYDKWEKPLPGGGCSAISKKVSDGTMLVGRNMDLNISNKAAYIIRTKKNPDEKRPYDTIGLAYTFRDISPNYEEALSKGITEQFYKLLPFMCDDVMNDQGLHIEINMRNAEYWPTGEDKFACSGTNEDSDKKVYMFELTRYIAENCSSVSKVLDYVKTLDVYSQEHYWNYCFLISDRTGASGLLEFASNKVYWMPDEHCQTNFYINEETAKNQSIKSGLGRYQALIEGIDYVDNASSMFNLMDKISYYNIYKATECYLYHFDPRSENIGAFPWLTYETVLDDDKLDEILFMMDLYGENITKLTRQQQRNENKYWESTFTEVVDLKKKTILVRFFEDNKCKMLITFDKGTVIPNEL